MDSMASPDVDSSIPNDKRELPIPIENSILTSKMVDNIVYADEVSQVHTDLKTKEDELPQNIDNSSNKLEDCLENEDCKIENVSNDVVQANTSQSCAKKNRRKKKTKDSDEVSNDSAALENTPDNVESVGRMTFSMEHLNQVFRVFDISQENVNEETRSYLRNKSLSHCKVLKDDIKERRRKGKVENNGKSDGCQSHDEENQDGKYSVACQKACVQDPVPKSRSVKKRKNLQALHNETENPCEVCDTELQRLKNKTKGGVVLSSKTEQELAKLRKKYVEVFVRQQEGTSEGQSKTKKKNKSKQGQNKKGADVSGTPLKQQEKSTSKTTKQNQSKPFEDYWTMQAVMEGVQNGTVIEGAVRINAKRFTEAYVSSPTGGQDILIEGIVDRNRALEGDLVALILKDSSEWKLSRNRKPESKSSKSDADTSETKKEEEDDKVIENSSNLENNCGQKPQVTGKVVAILAKQHPRKCVGYLKLKNVSDKNALFSPRDNRVPRMHIPRDKCPPDFWLDPASKEKVLYYARLVKWHHGSIALGEIEKQIGGTGDVEAETEALLLDNDLDVTPYSESVSQKYSVLTNVITDEEVKKREDLRKECIITIDPQTAKDLDDAVSCKELENGNFEIGVHISDVTYFIEEESYLDRKISERATSIYLVDKVHHMLPEELCRLCSLLPQEDKFAYSVIWEISREDAKIVSQRIVRSVIHSCVKLAYDHAQNMLENPDKDWDPKEFPEIGNGFSLSDISKLVNNLELIAKLLRRQRFEAGALRIDQTKLYLQLDSNGNPVAVHEYINKDSHRLIEEFMLLANMSIAKFVYKKYPDIAFLRCHPNPHEYPLTQLQETMASRGIHLSITSAGSLQASLRQYSGDDFLSQTRIMVLNALCAKTMTRAKYFCSGSVKEEEFWHYALSVPYYTHFTSPIRRYADVMIHRLLNAALGHTPRPLWAEPHVSRIAANCNKKKYNAKLAGEQSTKLYLAVYVQQNQPCVEDAVVIDVKDHSFDVIVCKYGLTMRVYTSKLDVNINIDPLTKASPMKIMWKSTEDCPQPTLQIVDIFTIVKVNLFCDEYLKLEAQLKRPAPDIVASESKET